LPIQQVAKLHNTSVKMIERHYAKYIATALEDLARAAVVSLVPRSTGNVVPMGKARKGSSCGLDRIHSSDGAGNHADQIRTKLAD
jgi:hypothetical protein